jgi:hypothetical protein
MPIPKELFDSIGDSNIFTIVDLKQGFNQIVLATKDHKKTTFHGSIKLWEWLVMPFGLKNAPVFEVSSAWEYLPQVTSSHRDRI